MRDIHHNNVDVNECLYVGIETQRTLYTVFRIIDNMSNSGVSQRRTILLYLHTAFFCGQQ